MKKIFAVAVLSLGSSVSYASIEFLTIETLMHAQAQEALALSIVVPTPITQTLQYDFSVDTVNGLFGYQSLPGQSYGGMSYSLSGQGSLDSNTQTYTWLASGMLGSQTWSQTGQAHWVGDPTADVSGVVSLNGDVVGTFSGIVEFDDGSLKSTGHGTFTPTGGSPGKYDVTDLIAGGGGPWTLKWNKHLGQFVPVSSVWLFFDEGDGIFQGTSTVTIAAVPEPSSFALVGVSLIALLSCRPRVGRSAKNW